MNLPLLLDHCVELLKQWPAAAGRGIPAEKVVAEYIASRKYLGSRDRRFLQDLFWFVLRHLIFLEKSFPDLSAEDQWPRYCAAALRIQGGETPDFRGDADWTGCFAATVGLSGRRSADLTAPDNYPDFIVAALSSYLAKEDLAETLVALKKEPSVHLRINGLKPNANRHLSDLEPMMAGQLLLEARRLEKRLPLQTLRPYRNGDVEIQDEGSQLISRLADPKGGDTVIDLAAGGGGKTLHLAALMNNKGRLIASDISAARLRQLIRRAGRAGVGNLEIFPPGVLQTNFRGAADLVLLDAPCSGTGTLRRHPDLLFRQSERTRKSLIRTQKDLLAKADLLVRPGGVLVYATCSLLPEENQGQIEAFLRQHPEYSVESSDDLLQKQGLRFSSRMNPYLLLLPQDIDSDAFFAARLRKHE